MEIMIKKPEGPGCFSFHDDDSKDFITVKWVPKTQKVHYNCKNCGTEVVNCTGVIQEFMCQGCYTGRAKGVF